MHEEKEQPNLPSVMGRPFNSSLPGPAWDAIQKGVMRTVYRGIPCFKSPFDLSLYLQLLSRLRPRTVIEIGTKVGGSALFFADMLTADGTDGRVISVDIDPKVAFSDSRITFITGNALDLGHVLPESLLASLERPFLVIEDSSHLIETSIAVLEFFDQWLVSGDYIVIEDGIVSQLSGAHYEVYQDGPNRAVMAFLARHPDGYDIDKELCDHYGYNVTYNPNAWLRRR